VEIDAGLLTEEAEPRPTAKPLESLTDFKLPDETVGFEDGVSEIRATPSATKIESPIFSDTPNLAEPSFNKAIDALRHGTARASEDTFEKLENQLLAENDPVRPNPNAPKLLDPSQLGQQVPRDGDLLARAAEGQVAAPGNFSDLDTLLNSAGPIRKGTAPILMPTDLLFDYDQYVLREDAVSSLRKLGTLIQRNPQATFLIEGHTDSFGPDDYNLWLSHQRALAVKDWLVQAMRIDPRRIQTVGYGKRHLLVPPDRDVAGQQLNRRVEIVIRTR
jgi:outer membrane protein OmpA-like peptidoglycan-associated protein